MILLQVNRRRLDCRADTDEIVDVLWVLGEERFSRKIARAIAEARKVEPIVTTAQLSKIVSDAQPKKDQNKHPATRTFQAIRLHINEELSEVEQGLEAAVKRLEVGGRLAVISFHSLEDRLVKRALRDASRLPQGDPRMPLPDSVTKPRMRLMGKAIKAGTGEMGMNPRARSAVLRVAERTEPSDALVSSLRYLVVDPIGISVVITSVYIVETAYQTRQFYSLLQELRPNAIGSQLSGVG